MRIERLVGYYIDFVSPTGRVRGKMRGVGRGGIE